MRVLAGAWTAHVIWYLREGERCFTELHLDIAKVSAKVLTNCLRKLERERIIARLTKPTSPPTVWYGLTPVGQPQAIYDGMRPVRFAKVCALAANNKS
jgi:DNA-binding HxlR family transcriptional regulator